MNTPRNIAISIAILIGTFAAWEGLARGLNVPAFILPPPSNVTMALYRGFANGLYLSNLYATLASTFLGFLLACVIAFAFGVFVALNRKVEYFLYPYIVMFQSMPKVALAPLMIIWFGIGLSSKVVSAATVAFFPLMVNTIVGLKSADEDRVNLMRSLAASERQIFWMLRLPGALPFIMAGLEVAIVLSLIGAIVAEFVGAQSGLGMLIQSMNFTFDVAGQFSVLLVLSFLGLVLNRAIAILRRRILFWSPAERGGLEPAQAKGDAA
ncbi:MAG TPA: ABC transporter permease [Candidatus Cybelea sp.]|nr:ABC transporter permease [Candidatus Cybelea sp.]